MITKYDEVNNWFINGFGLFQLDQLNVTSVVIDIGMFPKNMDGVYLWLRVACDCKFGGAEGEDFFESRAQLLPALYRKIGTDIEFLSLSEGGEINFKIGGDVVHIYSSDNDTDWNLLSGDKNKVLCGYDANNGFFAHSH